jgi:curli biogenesis system outer membrane secretion channel CsgG
MVEHLARHAGQAAVLAAATAFAGTALAQSGAAGASASGNGKVERCSETLGTLRIEENTSAPWYSYYNSNYRLGSTVPLLRSIIQQSNCFVIVERGRGMEGIKQERAEMRGDEGRAGSNFGTGQQVGADYQMSPEILMNQKGTKGGTAAIGNLLGKYAPALAGVAGTAKMNEAGTVLLLVDVRSTVQIASSEGYSKNWDFGVGGGIFSTLGVGGGSAYTNSAEGKLVAAAFVDAYNNMVVALRNYQAQTVKGGLGTGGRLGVQGGQTPNSPPNNPRP